MLNYIKYTSQRIFTSDMFWYGVGATCYPRYKSKHQRSHILTLWMLNLSLFLSLSLLSLFSHFHYQITLTICVLLYEEALCLPDISICIHTLHIQYIYALSHLLQYMLSCLLIFFGITHLFRDYGSWLNKIFTSLWDFQLVWWSIRCWSRHK